MDVFRLHANHGPDQPVGQIVESPRYFRTFPVRLVRHSSVHHDLLVSGSVHAGKTETSRCRNRARVKFSRSVRKTAATNNARRLFATHSLIAPPTPPPTNPAIKSTVCCPRLVTITTPTAIYYKTLSLRENTTVTICIMYICIHVRVCVLVSKSYTYTRDRWPLSHPKSIRRG